MTGHTPGPWRDASMLFSAGWRCIVNLPGGRSIDIADPQNRMTDEEDRANAALIAAAPEILAERDRLRLQVQDMQKVVDIAVKMAQSEDGHDYICSLIDAAGAYADKQAAKETA